MGTYINTRVTNTGVGTSSWVILGQAPSADRRGASKVGLGIEASGTATVSIQCTLSPLAATDTVPAAQITDITNLTALIDNSIVSIEGPIVAVRINQTAGAGISALTVLSQE